MAKSALTEQEHAKAFCRAAVSARRRDDFIEQVKAFGYAENTTKLGYRIGQLLKHADRLKKKGWK